MALNIGKEITALKRMTVPELRRKYTQVFGEDTTSRHKEYLIRRIVWRLQVNQEGVSLQNIPSGRFWIQFWTAIHGHSGRNLTRSGSTSSRHTAS